MELSKYNKPFSHTSDSEVGILLIHGITSTTSSLMYLAETFAEAGFNVELSSLSGHGTKWQDMINIRFTDWINDLEADLKKLKKRCSKIFLCGLSLGGGLALHLAGKHSELSGIILINHAAKFTSPKFWFVPLLRHFVKSVPAVASDIKDPGSKEIAYDRTPVKGVYEMLKMMKEMRRMLPEIMLPVLIFKSEEDHVIPISSAKYTMQTIGSKDKELIMLKNSFHVAPLDFEKELIVEKSIEFINKRN